MSFVTRMECRRCQTVHQVDPHLKTCPLCNSTLNIVYDYEGIQRQNRRIMERCQPGVWKYLELLPLRDKRNIVTLGEGNTCLHKCDRLAKQLHLRELFIKNETLNPTGSFIDRGVTVDLSKAKEMNQWLVCCATRGNLGASLAAYAARAGVKCTIFLPTEVNLGKLYQMLMYGIDIKLAKDYDEASSKASKMEKSHYLISQGNPFYLEGLKTAGYEICEQLRWKIPDRIIVPMGDGGFLSMIWKGITEMREIDLIKEVNTMMTGVQAEGVSPIVKALLEGRDHITAIKGGRTIAIDMGMERPFHGDSALYAIKESHGTAVAVSDKEILEAEHLLARLEGIFAEPAGASSVAGLKKLVDSGDIERDERIVCAVTGMGLKDTLSVRSIVREYDETKILLKRLEERRLISRIGETKLRILETIGIGESYGYLIWKELKKRFDIEIKIPTVYQHLMELESIGFVIRAEIKEEAGRRRCFYTVTNKGRELLKSLEEA